MKNNKLAIDSSLVQRMIAKQFPQFMGLPITPVASSGWDNRTFKIGKNMVVRMPSAEGYAIQVEKEQKWLPRLAPLLPLHIPEPLAMGQPTDEYPWKWSIYSWIEGETVAAKQLSEAESCSVATSLAEFIFRLEGIDTAGGPSAGLHNFYRGGSLKHYDVETRQAITDLRNKIDTNLATELWEKGLASTWKNAPVWVHGDVSAGNLLLKNNMLHSVIDFGMLGVGDPACDLVIAWTLFKGKSRDAFRETLSLDTDTWARGRAWAFWKAAIVASNKTNTNSVEINQCWRVIDEVLADHMLKPNRMTHKWRI